MGQGKVGEMLSSCCVLFLNPRPGNGSFTSREGVGAGRYLYSTGYDLVFNFVSQIEDSIVFSPYEVVRVKTGSSNDGRFWLCGQRRDGRERMCPFCKTEELFSM